MLRRILGESASEEFFRDHYRKAPFARPFVARGLQSILTWEAFWDLVPQIPENDVLVVEDGRLLGHVVPRTGEEARSLLEGGRSVVLRHTERFDSSLAALARDLESELSGSAVVQLYSTPAAHHSFGWHYDAEDVFIVQTAGEKRYFLRENTVNPRPSLLAMPKDMQYEKEKTPILSTRLIAGDFLYIPGGWWHVAKADTDSLSISIGVLDA